MKYSLLITLFLNFGLILGCTSLGAANSMSTPAVSIEGTAWQLERLGGQPALKERPVTLVFKADKQLGGEAGCNNYGATYKLNGNQLTIGEIAATMMACAEPEIMEQEQQYLTSLGQAVSYKVEGKRLIILDAKGANLLSFVGR